MSCVLVVCFFIAVMYRLLGLDTISFVIGWMDGMHGFWGIFFFFFRIQLIGIIMYVFI